MEIRKTINDQPLSISEIRHLEGIKKRITAHCMVFIPIIGLLMYSLCYEHRKGDAPEDFVYMFTGVLLGTGALTFLGILFSLSLHNALNNISLTMGGRCYFFFDLITALENVTPHSSIYLMKIANECSDIKSYISNINSEGRQIKVCEFELLDGYYQNRHERQAREALSRL